MDKIQELKGELYNQWFKQASEDYDRQNVDVVSREDYQMWYVETLESIFDRWKWRQTGRC